MRSSTSSSSDRIPDGPWIATGILAVTLAVALLGGWELFWRSRGFLPAFNDDDALWSNARRHVRTNDPEQFVLLGASRIQCGTDLSAFAEVVGTRPVQLAVDGSSSLPILEHLARTSSFRGKVVVDLWPWAFYKADPTQGVAGARVKAFEQSTFSMAVEEQLCLLVQNALAFRLPDLSVGQLWSLYQKRQWPKRPYTRLFIDRERRADYTMVQTLDVPMYLPPPIKPPGDPNSRTPEQWRATVERIQESASKIQARGGQVVFFSFPSSGTTRRWEEDSWPRWKYWDVLAQYTTAVTIHPDDYISLRGWHCPDGSHLDFRTAPAFTRAFATVVKARLAGRQAADYEPPEVAASRINYAHQAEVLSSTAFEPNFPVEHFIREPDAADWSAISSAANPNTVIIDLGQPRVCKRADLLMLVYEGHSGWVTDHAMHVSDDRTMWRTVFDARDPRGGESLRAHPSALGYDLSAMPAFRYLRLTIRQALSDDRALIRRLRLLSDYVDTDRFPPLRPTAVTPAADENDLARGATARVEPACVPGHELFWALRGRRDANYAELTPGSQTFELDLGWTVAAGAVELYTAATRASFDIAASSDGTTWARAAGAAAPSEPAVPAGAVHAFALPPAQPIRYLRIECSGVDEALRIFQIKLPKATGGAGPAGVSTHGGG